LVNPASLATITPREIEPFRISRIPVPEPHDPEAFYFDNWRRGRPVTKGALTSDLWRHQTAWKTFEFKVLFANDGELQGAVECTIHADNLSRNGLSRRSAVRSSPSACWIWPNRWSTTADSRSAGCARDEAIASHPSRPFGTRRSGLANFVCRRRENERSVQKVLYDVEDAAQAFRGRRVRALISRTQLPRSFNPSAVERIEFGLSDCGAP
jgi:hypothetical protein